MLLVKPFWLRFSKMKQKKRQKSYFDVINITKTRICEVPTHEFLARTATNPGWTLDTGQCIFVLVQCCKSLQKYNPPGGNSGQKLFRAADLSTM